MKSKKVMLLLGAMAVFGFVTVNAFDSDKELDIAASGERSLYTVTFDQPRNELINNFKRVGEWITMDDKPANQTEFMRNSGVEECTKTGVIYQNLIVTFKRCKGEEYIYQNGRYVPNPRINRQSFPNGAWFVDEYKMSFKFLKEENADAFFQKLYDKLVKRHGVPYSDEAGVWGKGGCNPAGKKSEWNWSRETKWVIRDAMVEVRVSMHKDKNELWYVNINYSQIRVGHADGTMWGE